MAEYIEREALMKDAAKNKAIGRCEADIVDVRHLINSQPAADVAPVVHGRWKEINHHRDVEGWIECDYVCSACNEITGEHFNYCPNCGAKMDGGKHG